MFELRESPGRGLGLLAIKHIQKGCRIFAEKALVCLPPGALSAESLWQQFDDITVDRREKFDRLVCVEDARTPLMRRAICSRLGLIHDDETLDEAVATELRMRAIFSTNCVTMGTESR